MTDTLTDNDWKEVEQVASMKIWNGDWQEEEIEGTDETLKNVAPDFIAEDGRGRSVRVLVQIIRHPKQGEELKRPN